MYHISTYISTYIWHIYQYIHLWYIYFPCTQRPFFVDFRPARAEMTTVLDPDPATASHLVGPTEPNFADWFKRLDADGPVRGMDGSGLSQ